MSWQLYCTTFVDFYVVLMHGQFNCFFFSLLIEYVQNPSVEAWKGYIYVVALVCANMAQALFNNTYMYIAFRLGMRLECKIWELME